MYIYKITNTITGKTYIGQTTKTVPNRVSQHKKDSKNGTTYLANAIRKYGWDMFEVDVICECESKEKLDEMECYYIKQYKMTTGVYNLTNGGATGTYGHKRPEMVGDLNPAKTPEARKKISDAIKGHKRPDLTKRTIERTKGKTYEELYGVDKASKIKESLSKSHKGKKMPPRTPEHTINLTLAKQKIIYEMISPSGEIIIHKNLAEFARKYGLNISSLMDLVRGKIKSGVHKGWRGRIIK